MKYKILFLYATYETHMGSVTSSSTSRVIEYDLETDANKAYDKLKQDTAELSGTVVISKLY